MSDERDQQVLAERIAGGTLRDIGAEHGLSYEGVRLIVIREGRRHIDQLVVQMWAAQKAGQLLTLGVPAGSPEEQRYAVQYFEWVLGQLQARDDVEPRVTYRPTPDGSFAFAIEDVSFKPKEDDR